MSVWISCLDRVRRSDAVRRAFAGVALLLGAGMLGASPASAAESIVVNFGPLSRSFSITEFQTLAETGQPSRKLRWYLNTAGVKPSTARSLLTQQVPLPLEFVDQILNSLPGEFGLYQLGQVISPSSQEASLQAMRAAVVLSAADDNRVSMLEILENYPTRELHIDGLGLMRTARDVQNLMSGSGGTIEGIARGMENLLPGLFCECARNAAGGGGDSLPRVDDPAMSCN
ncbi:MAG: alpha/beta hydrolase [Cyanobacteriota bacterium]